MRFFSLILLLVFAVDVRAQLQINSLPDLLNYADSHAPAAQQAKLQPSISAQDVKIQSSGLYPKVNAFAGGDYYPLIPTQIIPAEILGGAPGTYYKAQFGLPYVFTAGAEISMPVINLEKWTQLSKARAQYDQSVWGSKAALENFHIQLIQAYYQSLVTKEVLKLNDENENTSNELMRIMEDRHVQGVLNPSDYNRSKNLQLDVQTTGLNYTKALQQSINNLRSMLYTGSDSFMLGESISAFNWVALTVANEPETRPGWKEADTKLRVAELALSESKKGGLPKLNLNGRYTYNMQSKFESGSNNVEFNSANIGLRLDFPLFQGGYYRALQQKSKLQLKSAQFEQERTRATLTQQQEDWRALYVAAYSKHFVLEQKVKTTSDNLRIARLNIKEGTMEFDEFNNIFMEYNRAKMDNLQNLADGILYYLLSTQNF